MNRKEYAKYLYDIIGEEIDVDSDDLDAQFYGYFQSFMPDGNGLEKVFTPIENGDLYFDRLIKIYSVTEDNFKKLARSGAVPAYFSPTSVKDKESLLTNGNVYIENLKLFSQMIDDQEFKEIIADIKTIEITDNDKRRYEDNDTNEFIRQTISDWFIANTDFDAIINILDEAYYSISCDIYLADYFQYPRYMEQLNVDLFAPYFEIWKMGSYCWFDKGKLIIGK